MKTIIILLTIAISVVAAMHWGRVLSVKLPDISHWFDRKPFNCRPCFTFHLVWILCACVAAVYQSALLLIAGGVAAFVVFIIVWYIDNKKIEK